MLRSTHRPVCALLLLAPMGLGNASLRAQKPKVVPPAFTSVEGSRNAYFPFTYEFTHNQQIWLGSSVTSSTAFIKGISYRRDTGSLSSNAAVAGRTFKSVNMSVGTTLVAPGSMSTTFAKNLGKSMTTVLSGKFVLPSQPKATTGPAKFNINLPFSKPFIFPGSQGNLIFDMILPGGKSNSKTPYYVDAESSAPGKPGSSSAYGKSGSFKLPETFKLVADSSRMAPGGTFDLSCGTFSKAYSGMLILGISKTKWGNSNLPLSLGFMGATNNFLYASLDFQLPFSAVKSGNGYVSRFRATIPNLAIYKNITLHTQAYYNDAPANPAGLVTTHGLTVNFSSTFAGPITNLIGNSDSGSKTGFTMYPSSIFGGPIVRFDGIIP